MSRRRFERNASGRRPRRAGLAARLFGALALPLAGAALAHDARPLSIGIVAQTADTYRVVMRAPPTLDDANVPRIVWPPGCETRERAGLALEPGRTSLVVCADGLEGRDLAIEYPANNPSLTTLVRIDSHAQGLRTAVLPPDTLTWTVPAEPDRLTVARDYVALGFEHIWEGPDHLLFVAGLMLLARRPRSVLVAVTGFTAAHSITLSLAALGLVTVRVETVEAMIALSIMFLAADIGRGDTTSFSYRFPFALSFVFGLLHGFGFASALGEIGLPANEITTSLLAFNVGVELGQGAFIAAAAVPWLVWSRLRRTVAAQWRAPLETRATAVGAYALGVPAAYWFVTRTVQAFGL